MRPLLPVIALSTLCLTACADQRPTRAVPLTPDPARLAGCPETLAAPPSLAPLAAFTLPDGRQAVLLSTVIEREHATVSYIVGVRGAWHDCRSAVEFVDDWSARLGAQRGER